jgi:hypothetical protein
MILEFHGDAESEFRTVAAVEVDAAWVVTPFETSVVLQPPPGATRIRLIVTRSEPGTGAYTVSIHP